MGKKAENGTELKFLTDQSVAFDVDAFDDAIRSQGVKFIHYRAMRCPVGRVDKYDDRRPHDDHSDCSNGFIYTEAGTITALFLGNGNNRSQNDVGLLDGSTVQVTAPRFYDDTETTVDVEIQVIPFDRFYLAENDITVTHWQLAEAHATGKDKLSFPVVDVVDLMDATGRRFKQGIDFQVEGGQIVWIGDRPGFDAQENRGVIYSVRYTYRPYFYVSNVIHQVRVAQVETVLERKVMRMPQGFVLVREHVFEKEQADPQAASPNSPRQAKSAEDGPFGPR